MKRLTYTLLTGVLFLGPIISFTVPAAEVSYGMSATTQLKDSELTIENMLRYAIEDEYLARGEYQKIMEKFGEQRPFSNIIKAENRHISWLEPLLKKYGVSLPEDRGEALATVPENYADTFQIGIKAEELNIDMYSRFLAQPDLPQDIRDVFSRLKKGSENHLAAFQRGVR